MMCNYDAWGTKVVKSITPKMLSALKVMGDGIARSRCEMLRAADIEPNPRNSFAGFEKTDYYLYKQGLIECVAMRSQEKVFKINAKGLEALKM